MSYTPVNIFGRVWDSLSAVHLQVLVVFVCLVYLLPVVKIFLAYTIGKIFFSKRKYLKHAGEWAIVTGATDGIGKAYAEELAKDGLNIMLISRSLEKLKNVATEIESSYHVKTRVVVADYTQNNIYESIEKEINDLSSIACLVNNVGMSYSHFDSYTCAKFINCNFIQNMIACNAQSVAIMTYLVLPKLLKQGRNGSAIINIGSFLGCLPSPYITLYGATKAFVHHFSRSIMAELNLPLYNEVIIQTVYPLFVATAMSGAKKPSLFIPSARSYAKSALDMLGVEEFTTGYFAHAIQGYLISSLPLSWVHNKYKKIADKARRKYQ